MNCTFDTKLINAYIDKQLDAANAVEVEQQMHNCKHCKQKHQDLLQLTKSVRKHAIYHTAPVDLQQSIMESLGSTSTASPTKKSSFTIKRKWAMPLSFAASILVGIIISSVYLHRLEDERLVDDILTEHVNAITANRLSDIQSNNIEQLAQWFTKKLDYSPKIFDLSTQGFEMLGGRLNALNTQRIATITYKHNHHVINLYTWPSPDKEDALQEQHNKQGYQLIYWCNNYMNYWIVSDADKETLLKFAKNINANLKNDTEK